MVSDVCWDALFFHLFLSILYMVVYPFTLTPIRIPTWLLEFQRENKMGRSRAPGCHGQQTVTTMR